jgi:hypothetical protein
LGQEIKDCSAVGIGIVNDVTGAIVDSVSSVASLICDGVFHIRNRGTGVTAALCQLRGQIACVLCRLIAEGTHSIVNTVETLKDCGVHTIETLTQSVLNAVKVVENCGIVETCGKVCLCCTRRATATALTCTIATAEATKASVTAPSKEEQNDDPPSAVIAPTKSAIIVLVSTYSGDVSGGHFTCS